MTAEAVDVGGGHWRAWCAALPSRLGAAWPANLGASLEAERARWFVWIPVLFGAGIAGYFLLPGEPPLVAVLAAPVVAGSLALARGGRLAAAPLLGAALAVALGFAAGKLRSDWVEAPALAREIKADITGWVELAEPRAKRGVRLTLRVAAISGPAEGLPRRARIGVRRGAEDVRPGDFVSVRARLSPPAQPSLPGDYDFARAAWFQGLGAVGYALAPPERVAPPGSAPAALAYWSAVERLRLAIGARVRAALPGESGAIANALITGDRGAISEETTEAFRNSGLLHIMSISGLHMAVMAGTVFAAVRIALALIPALALRYPTKKWAAAAAAMAAFGYLLISGSASPTVRAFLMIAIMFLAVICDRPALAMRNVALSALAILVAWPENVLDVGFQMSFAAVVSLIAVYEVVRERAGDGLRQSLLLRVAAFFGGIVLSTLVASLAVAPFAAYHFHKSQQLAILANLVAIPICNLVVMPAGLATLVAMPLGVEALPLRRDGVGGRGHGLDRPCRGHAAGGRRAHRRHLGSRVRADRRRRPVARAVARALARAGTWRHRLRARDCPGQGAPRRDRRARRRAGRGARAVGRIVGAAGAPLPVRPPALARARRRRARARRGGARRHLPLRRDGVRRERQGSPRVGHDSSRRAG